MRITFQRMADRRSVETVVERDDGVVFAMRGAGGGADLPHDLVHAVVETALPLADGIWGCVADGVVWGSMRHVSGRAAGGGGVGRRVDDVVPHPGPQPPCSRAAGAGTGSAVAPRLRAVTPTVAACAEWPTTGSVTTTS